MTCPRYITTSALALGAAILATAALQSTPAEARKAGAHSRHAKHPGLKAFRTRAPSSAKYTTGGGTMATPQATLLPPGATNTGSIKTPNGANSGPGNIYGGTANFPNNTTEPRPKDPGYGTGTYPNGPASPRSFGANSGPGKYPIYGGTANFPNNPTEPGYGTGTNPNSPPAKILLLLGPSTPAGPSSLVT